MSEGQRGRPKRNAIDRINIAIDLKDNRKFSLLMEYSGLTEGPVLLMLWGLWQFTGSNYAFDGDCILEQKETGEIEVTEWINPKLSRDDGPGLRRACCFVGQSDFLISLFQKAGFLGNDLEVIGWFENQPLAAKLVVKRKLGQLGGKKSADKRASERAENPTFLDQNPAKNCVDNSKNCVDNSGQGNFSALPNSSASKYHQSSRGAISDDSLGIKVDSLGISDAKSPTQSRSPKSESLIPNSEAVNSRKPGVVATLRARDAATPVNDEPSANGRGSEEFFDQMAFMGRLQEFITITPNDVAGIISDLRKYPDQANWECVFEQLNQMRVDNRLHKLKSPVGFVRKTIRGGSPDP